VSKCLPLVASTLCYCGICNWYLCSSEWILWWQRKTFLTCPHTDAHMVQGLGTLRPWYLSSPTIQVLPNVGSIKLVYLKCPKQWGIILLGGNITEGFNWNNCLLLLIIKNTPLVLTSYLIKINTYSPRSRDNKVGIVMGYRLGMAWVQFLAEAWDFSLLHSTQAGFEAHPTSYPVGTRELFPWGIKRPGCEAHNSLPSSAEFNNGGAIHPFLILLHGVVLN
jgi:hypothetical protein